MTTNIGNAKKSLSSTSPSSIDTFWILDSGAIDHMVNSPTILTNFSLAHNRNVQLQDGSFA